MAQEGMAALRTGPRDLAVLALIPLIPLLSGLAMLEPGRHTFLGLATTSFALVAPAMLLGWPVARRGLWPGGRIAPLALMMLAVGLTLAVTQAHFKTFSVQMLGLWGAAMIAGRAVQLRLRAGDPDLVQAVLVAILLAGPLYIVLLPLMELVYGTSHDINWSREMPGFRHVRKMGHLLTASAAVGVGLMLLHPPQARPPRVEAALTVLAIIALGLAIWSGARGAWAALFMALVIAVITGWVAGHAMRPVRMGAVLAGALAVAAILPEPGAHLGLLGEITSSANRIGDINKLTSDRVWIWTDALAAIGQAPLTGHGWGQFVHLAPHHRVLHAHDLPLDLVLGLGIPGGLVVLGLMLTLWGMAQRRAALQGNQFAAALPLLNTMAFYSLVSGTYFYGVPLVLTGIAWGICLAPRPAERGVAPTAAT